MFDVVLTYCSTPLYYLHRYAITVWYFDGDERARAKEKYLTGILNRSFCTFLLLYSLYFNNWLTIQPFIIYGQKGRGYIIFDCSDLCCCFLGWGVFTGAGEKGVKMELNKPSDDTSSDWRPPLSLYLCQDRGGRKMEVFANIRKFLIKDCKKGRKWDNKGTKCFLSTVIYPSAKLDLSSTVQQRLVYFLLHCCVLVPRIQFCPTQAA